MFDKIGTRVMFTLAVSWLKQIDNSLNRKKILPQFLLNKIDLLPRVAGPGERVRVI